MTTSRKIAIQVAASLPSRAFVDHRDFLSALYEKLKGEISDYTWILFALDLGFGKTNVLHQIAKGKRPLTAKTARRIADALELHEKNREYFLTLVEWSAARTPVEKEKKLAALLALRTETLDAKQQKFQMEYLSEWYHPVIREMTFLRDFSSNGGWIASRIHPRIRPEQARKSLILLESLGMIRFDQAKGRHVPEAQNITSGDEIDSLAVVRFHQEMIELGKDSITTVEEEQRDIGAVTVCVDKNAAALMKRELQAFRKKILAIADQCREPDRVFQVNMQYFPVSRVEGTKS